MFSFFRVFQSKLIPLYFRYDYFNRAKSTGVLSTLCLILLAVLWTSYAVSLSDCDHEHLYSMFKLKNRFPSNALTCLVIVSRFVRLPGNSLDIHNEGGGSTMLF